MVLKVVVFSFMPPTLKHWRCGGILCSVLPVPLLIKDTKAH